MNFWLNNNSTNNSNKMDLCQQQPSTLNLRYNPINNNEIHNLINTLLYGSYAYIIISSHFKTKGNTLDGMAKLFKQLSDEKRQIALEMIEYQQTQGVSVIFKNIQSINQSNWSIFDAMKNAMDFEKKVQTTLGNIKKSSSLNLSYHLQKFCTRQTNVINQLNQIYNECNRCVKNGTNKLVFDRNLLNKLS
jgi:ferritin